MRKKEKNHASFFMAGRRVPSQVKPDRDKNIFNLSKSNFLQKSSGTNPLWQITFSFWSLWENGIPHGIFSLNSTINKEVNYQQYLQRVLESTLNQLKNHNINDWYEIFHYGRLSQPPFSKIAGISNDGLIKRHRFSWFSRGLSPLKAKQRIYSILSEFKWFLWSLLFRRLCEDFPLLKVVQLCSPVHGRWQDCKLFWHMENPPEVLPKVSLMPQSPE